MIARKSINPEDYIKAEKLLRNALRKQYNTELESCSDEILHNVYIFLSSFSPPGRLYTNSLRFCLAQIAVDMKVTLIDRCIKQWGKTFYADKIEKNLLSENEILAAVGIN